MKEDGFDIKIRVAGKYMAFKDGSQKIKAPDFFKLVLTPKIVQWKDGCGLVNTNDKKKFEDFNVINVVPLFGIVGMLVLTIIMMLIVLRKFKTNRLAKRERMSLNSPNKSPKRKFLTSVLDGQDREEDSQSSEEENVFPGLVYVNTVNTLENGYSIPKTSTSNGNYYLASRKF